MHIHMAISRFFLYIKLSPSVRCGVKHQYIKAFWGRHQSGCHFKMLQRTKFFARFLYVLLSLCYV